MQQSFPKYILYGADYNPEQWPEAVWLDDMRLMHLAGVNMVSVNIFSWAALEPGQHAYHFDQLDRIMDMLAEDSIAVDLATATASPPTWMSRLYPNMLPVTRDGKRFSHGSRQHYCPNSLDYQRFSSDVLLSCYLNEANILREITPNIPLTTNLMVGFKPADYFAWAPHLDVISFDNYPARTTPPWETALIQDLMRSLKNGQPHLVMDQTPTQFN